MTAACGPGPVLVDVDDLPEGWEAFATNNGDKYFSFPQIYYHCRKLDKVQWEAPGPEDGVGEGPEGATINGKRPYRLGDEFIPEPPPPRPYEGPFSDATYAPSCEPSYIGFREPRPADEALLQACLDCDIAAVRRALDTGADVRLANHPWQNTPLHLAHCAPFWDADTIGREKEMRHEIASYLVDQGADVDAENKFGCRPIDFAVFHNYPGSAAYLSERGAKTGLTAAAFANDVGRVQQLIREGEDIDLQGRYGRTAFAEAHLRGHWQLEAFLAQQGCCRKIPHPENLKFNPSGGAIPRGNLVPRREIQYHREEDPAWYDDMMEKRFPGYAAKRELLPRAG